MSSEEQPLPRSGTTTKPTPKSGSPNKNAAKSGTTNAQTAKSRKTSTPTKDDTIHRLQKDLDVCRQQNAMLRARFNPTKIRKELQKEPTVNQDPIELHDTQIRELMEEILTLKSGTSQQDSKTPNKSGTTTEPTPESGSTNTNEAKSGTTNTHTTKSGQTTLTKNETICKLQAELDACRQQNALLRAGFNPTKIREELQKEPTVNQDPIELYDTQIRELMEEILTLKSGTSQQDSKTPNKSGTTTEPTPESGSTNTNEAKSGTTNTHTTKSGQTTLTKHETICKLQAELDA